MAPPPPPPVRCGENEAVALYLLDRRRAMAENAEGFSENLDATLSAAYRNICAAHAPIRTLKDLSQVKGVGRWILRLMKPFFPEPAEDATTRRRTKTATVAKGPKKYLPQKNSAAYSLLIALYRGTTAEGKPFMTKQDLIDAAEASGLARTAIGPDRGAVAAPSSFRPSSSARNWYTGWSCMKTLVAKGLVVKSSCPAKYMLTDEGREAASRCLERSGLADLDGQNQSNQRESTCSSSDHSNSIVESVHPASKSAKGDILDLDDSSVWKDPAPVTGQSLLSTFSSPANSAVHLRACNTSRSAVLDDDLALPPRVDSERFSDVYTVSLVLDDRESFGGRGGHKVIDGLRAQFNIPAELRRLPVGDGIWVARHKRLGNEYVLDFIVERKRVDDLSNSIRDNRYRDQKLRLRRCGLNKLIYLVEGDPNAIDAAASVKTACFTTEILEGFDVQRTTGIVDTIRRYGHLTRSIIQCYAERFGKGDGRSRACPTYDEFVRRCEGLKEMTVGDVFALQLMQVPQVTEEAAIAVTEAYPTVLSLAREYAKLEGDARAQEELLKSKCRGVGTSASRNIFKLIWGS